MRPAAEVSVEVRQLLQGRDWVRNSPWRGSGWDPQWGQWCPVVTHMGIWTQALREE